jgi:hypothetical protein
MRTRKTGYMEKIPVADLNRIWETLSRENLEAMLYDLAFQDGVLNGLDIVPNSPVGLSVIVQTGRGLWRDSSTKRGKIMECFANTVFNLSAFVPVSGSAVVYVYAEPLTDTGGEASITPPNAPLTHPAYDPGYTPTTFDPITRDNIQFSAGITIPATGSRIILAAINLTAGQTAINTADILYGAREVAGSSEMYKALNARITLEVSATRILVQGHVNETIGAHKASTINTSQLTIDFNDPGPVVTLASPLNPDFQTGQDALNRLFTQIKLLQETFDHGKLVFLGEMPGGAGGASNTLTIQETGAGIAGFMLAEKTIGTVAGAGIDYVLPNFATSIPSDAKALLLNARLSQVGFQESELFVGTVADVSTLPSIAAVGSSKVLIGAGSTFILQQDVCACVPVSFLSSKKFKFRVVTQGVDTTATEYMRVDFTLLGYVK